MTGSVMKVLVLPREDENPYQALLYREMYRCGARVSYLGTLTRSRTLNLLLLPAELAVRRLAGARLIHLHWVYGFSFPYGYMVPVLQRLAQAWFTVWLSTVRVLGMRLVWTAHNVLPRPAVFADDVRARRQLVGACDLVLAHSDAALAELATLGIVPRKSAVIPHGPFAPSLSARELRTPGTGAGPRRLLFFGKVMAYKGVEDLLAAFAAIPAEVPVHLTIAGHCADPALRSALRTLASHCGERVSLQLERVPDQEVTRLLADADAVVLPFKQITTSGSAVLALCHGRPLVLPDRAALPDIPPEAVVRHDGTVPGLTAALVRVARADARILAAMSAAARTYPSKISWKEIAETTFDNMTRILADGTRESANVHRAALP